MAQRPKHIIYLDESTTITPEDWAALDNWMAAQFPISRHRRMPYHEGHIMDKFIKAPKRSSMQRKAFVLLSGGLDSTTCLFKAVMDYMPEDPGMRLAYGDKYIWHDVLRYGVQGTIEIPWVEAFSVDYGQRHTKELEYAKGTCDRLGIRHTILDVGSLLSGKTVMLSRESIGTVDVPNIDYADIKGVSPTYVPFRNGLMLSAITAQVQKYVNDQIAEAVDTGLQEKDWAIEQEQDARKFFTEQAKDLCGVYFGAHSEDAQNWAYPDCTPEFIGAMANAIYIGSYMTIRLHTPLEWLLKSDIVALGDKLGVPFEDTWSCYKGEEFQCGTCPTCRSRKEAFKIAGVKDPTIYADHGNTTTPNAEA